MMYDKDVTKEELIKDIRFKNGEDHFVDVLRIENVGSVIGGKGPLLISSKMPVQSDSLGSLRLEMNADTLSRVIAYIIELDTKIQFGVSSEALFRITYRRNGFVGQFYVAYPEASTLFFRSIEKRIIQTRNDEALWKFYMMLYTSQLLESSSDGKFRWKYEN